MELYTAAWCDPCKQLKRWLEQKGIEVTIIDIDEQPEKVKGRKIRSLPTLVLDNYETRVGNEQIRPYLEELHASTMPNT